MPYNARNGAVHVLPVTAQTVNVYALPLEHAKRILFYYRSPRFCGILIQPETPSGPKSMTALFSYLVGTRMPAHRARPTMTANDVNDPGWARHASLRKPRPRSRTESLPGAVAQ